MYHVSVFYNEMAKDMQRSIFFITLFISVTIIKEMYVIKQYAYILEIVEGEGNASRTDMLIFYLS